jgi:hypothetical protein
MAFMRRVLMALAATAFAASAASCRNEASSPATPTSADEAYQAILDALAANDGILHARVHTTMENDGQTQPMYTTDLWADVRQSAVRLEFHKDPNFEADLADEAVSMVVGQYEYVTDDPGEALRYEARSFCPESDSPLLGTILCGFPHATEGTASAGIEPDVDYQGRAATAIVFGYIPGEATPEGTQAVSRIYLDKDTHLPMAHVTEASSADGQQVRIVSAYENEFVSADSLPADFLDPRSIGYGAEDAAASLDTIGQAVPVYWLGEEFDPGGGVEPLVLAQVDAGQDTIPGRHLYYETPNGIPGAYVFLWTSAEWENFLSSFKAGRFLETSECVQRSQVSFRGGQADVYMMPLMNYPVSEPCEQAVVDLGPENEAWPAFRWFAVVRVGDVVVDVRADVVGDHESPEAMLALLNGLRPR